MQRIRSNYPRPARVAFGPDKKLAKSGPKRLVAMTYNEATEVGAPILIALTPPSRMPSPVPSLPAITYPEDCFPALPNKKFDVLEPDPLPEIKPVTLKRGGRGYARGVISAASGFTLRASTTSTTLKVSHEANDRIGQDTLNEIGQECVAQGQRMEPIDFHVYDTRNNYVFELLALVPDDAKSRWMADIAAEILAKRTVKVYYHRNHNALSATGYKFVHEHQDVCALTEAVLVSRQWNDLLGATTLFSYEPGTVVADLRTNPRYSKFIGPEFQLHFIRCIVNEIRKCIVPKSPIDGTLTQSLRDLLVARYKQNDKFVLFAKDSDSFDSKLGAVSKGLVDAQSTTQVESLPLLLVKKAVIYAAIVGITTDKAKANDTHRKYTTGALQTALGTLSNVGGSVAPVGGPAITALGNATTALVMTFLNAGIPDFFQERMRDVGQRFETDVYQPALKGFVMTAKHKKQTSDDISRWGEEALQIFNNLLPTNVNIGPPSPGA